MNRRVLIAGAIVVVPILAILAANLGRDPHRLQTPLIGRAAPSFSLRQAGSSRALSLAELRGKPVVLNFWATWCVPCLGEHPVLQTAARNSDAQFIGVVFDDEEKRVLDFLQKYGDAYPTLLDDGGKTAIAYGIGGVPETYFIDRQGRIVDKADGPLDADSLRERLARIAK